MNSKYQLKKREKISLQKISGLLFILSGITCFIAFSQSYFRFGMNLRGVFLHLFHPIYNERSLLIISLFIIGIGFLFDYISIACVGCGIGIISRSIRVWWICTSLFDNEYDTFANLLERIYPDIVYIILFVFFLIFLIKRNNLAYYLNCILILFVFSLCIYCIYNFIEVINDSEYLKRYYFIHLIHFLSLFTSVSIYSIYLYNTIIKKTDKANNNISMRTYDSKIQIEAIIDRIFQLRGLVDNNIISIQEYVDTKQKILSPLFPSQQPLTSQNPIQFNMPANQVPQFSQPPIPTYQYSRTFQPNMPVNPYSGENRPDLYPNQYFQPYLQQSNSLGMNPFPKSIQEPRNNEDKNQNANQ